jgi:solute carrier family 25 oxoglutarate transporter 11
MNYSYKRFWEPSTTQAVTSSVAVGLVATALWHPLDMVKTRIQQRAEGIGIRQLGHYGGYNPNKIFREVHAQGNGMKGLYAGLDSALAARGVYLFARTLVYKVIYDRIKPKKPTNDLTNREKAVLASFAGAVGAIVSNPFEVSLIRQQTDGALAPERRRNYAGIFDAYGKIAAEKGSLGMFRGVVPSVFRAIALNASLSMPYNFYNEAMFNCFGETEANRPVALFIAAIAATFVVLPFDNIKTRMQYAFADPAMNRINYDGFVDCIRKVFLYESWTGFYVGFYASAVRTFLYGATTIYAMDVLERRSKKKAGLKGKYL